MPETEYVNAAVGPVVVTLELEELELEELEDELDETAVVVVETGVTPAL